MSGNVTVLNHAVCDHHLASIRDEMTSPEEFRRRMLLVSRILVAEATRNLPQVPTQVTTPLETTTCQSLSGRIAAVPILRAGLALVDPLLELIPHAEVWHLGMFRDESTAQPVHYYNKLPDNAPPETALVLDPMLATGGSACDAIEALKSWGVSDIRMLAVIAAPEGVARLNRDHPDVSICCSALDRELNDQKFILPGLGDAGDRIFGTIL